MSDEAQFRGQLEYVNKLVNKPGELTAEEVHYLASEVDELTGVADQWAMNLPEATT